MSVINQDFEVPSHKITYHIISSIDKNNCTIVKTFQDLPTKIVRYEFPRISVSIYEVGIDKTSSFITIYVVSCFKSLIGFTEVDELSFSVTPCTKSSTSSPNFRVPILFFQNTKVEPKHIQSN